MSVDERPIAVVRYHEHPVSPTRDRATIIEAMGGRRSAAPLFISALVILLIFIAGAVMLGIGNLIELTK